MFSRPAFGIFCLIAWGTTPSEAEEVGFDLAINKLEHLFSIDTTMFEIEAAYGDASRSVGIKSESEHYSGTYVGSENQLFLSMSINDRVTGFVGYRYLDWSDGGDSSAIVGLHAVVPFDVAVVISTFPGAEDQLEGRVEFERPTALTPRIELQPKIEFRTQSRYVESVSAELRLVYATTDRLQSYIGFSSTKFVRGAIDENDRVALAGISFQW